MPVLKKEKTTNKAAPSVMTDLKAPFCGLHDPVYFVFESKSTPGAWYAMPVPFNMNDRHMAKRVGTPKKELACYICKSNETIGGWYMVKAKSEIEPCCHTCNVLLM